MIDLSENDVMGRFMRSKLVIIERDCKAPATKQMHSVFIMLTTRYHERMLYIKVKIDCCCGLALMSKTVCGNDMIFFFDLIDVCTRI